MLKDVIPQREPPLYSLSKKPKTNVRLYGHNGQRLKATIPIYCISQVMVKLERDEKVSKRVRIDSQDFLTFTSRGTLQAAIAGPVSEPWSGQLDSNVYGDARNVTPDWDVHYLENRWRAWGGEEEIATTTERHYVKFCQTWFKKRWQL